MVSSSSDPSPPMVAAPCASPSTSPTRASPRAAPPRRWSPRAASRVGGEVVHRPGARRRRARAGSPSTAQPVQRPEASASSSRSTSPPASSRPRRTPHGRPDVVELVTTPAALPGRPPRRRHHRADPADQRRRARPTLTHPSYEVPRVYRAGCATRRCARRRCARCATASSSTTAGRRPRSVRRIGPNVLELTLHEGRKRQVRRMLDAVGHPVRPLTVRRAGLKSW